MSETRIVIDDMANTWEVLVLAKAKVREWELIAKAAMDDIKARIGDAEEAVIDGRPAIRHSTREVTRVDTKALRAEVPAEVLAPYLRTTTEHRYDLLED